MPGLIVPWLSTAPPGSLSTLTSTESAGSLLMTKHVGSPPGCGGTLGGLVATGPVVSVASIVAWLQTCVPLICGLGTVAVRVRVTTAPAATVPRAHVAVRVAASKLPPTALMLVSGSGTTSVITTPVAAALPSLRAVSVNVTCSPAPMIAAETALVLAAKSGTFWTVKLTVLVWALPGVSSNAICPVLAMIAPLGVVGATVALRVSTTGAAPGSRLLMGGHVATPPAKLPPSTCTPVSAAFNGSVTTTLVAGAFPVLTSSMVNVTTSPPWTSPPSPSLNALVDALRTGALSTVNTVGSVGPATPGSSDRAGAPSPPAVSEACALTCAPWGTTSASVPCTVTVIGALPGGRSPSCHVTVCPLSCPPSEALVGEISPASGMVSAAPVAAPLPVFCTVRV